MAATIPPVPSYIYAAELERVVDGDTIDLDIDLGFGNSHRHRVRLAGVDTPEKRGVERIAGQWVMAQVDRWIRERTSGTIVMDSRSFDMDKWGRCLANIWASGECLNFWLLQSGFGWPTDDNGQIIGGRFIERLELPDEIKREVNRVQ